MSNIDKRALREAAEKATPGVWVYLPKNTSIEYDYGSDDSQGSVTYMDSGDFTQKQTDLNGEFIAAANPATVLALLDELEAKDKLNAELMEKQRLIDICQGQGLEHRIAAEKRAEAAEKRNAELEAKKVKIKLPESFYPDGDIDCPLVINEYQIIEAIVAAGCKPIAVCPRCKCEIDLSHKPDGAHYCHASGTAKGE